MKGLQEAIYRLEEGGGMKWFKIAAALLLLVLLAVGYNWRAFKNMNSPEAMDNAQLARNIAEGRGYSTWFIRPFSMFLLQKHEREQSGAVALGTTSDSARVKGPHPDLANAPAYPVFLAGVMKVLPFRYEIPDKPQPFWFYSGRFYRYQPDFLISFVNQMLLVGVALMVYLIGKKLFDPTVGWVSALVVLGTELLWRFAVSGLSTTFLLLLFMGLIYFVILLEAQGREPTGSVGKIIGLAAVIGLLAGLGALTRYSFAWVILPVLVFAWFFSGTRRAILVPTIAIVFLIVFVPWIIRNYHVSGTLFGTAGYALLENTSYFPGDMLQRSLTPDLNKPVLGAFWSKLILGARELLSNDIPKLGGTWLTSFFLVGLLIGFRNPAARRVRYLVLGVLGVLAIAQALGRTALSDQEKTLTHENLLILLTPMVILYGVSLFFVLLDQIQFPLAKLRTAAIGLFGAVVCLPIFLTFLPPKTIPVAWPPYLPPLLEEMGKWSKPGELTMSDVPWAVAWYGRCPSVYYTLNTKSEFLAINDYIKPINMVYLSPVTLDSRFLSEWAKGPPANWGLLVLETAATRQVPSWFPLRRTPPGWLPNHMLLSDWDRWGKTNTEETTQK